MVYDSIYIMQARIQGGGQGGLGPPPPSPPKKPLTNMNLCG